LAILLAKLRDWAKIENRYVTRAAKCKIPGLPCEQKFQKLLQVDSRSEERAKRLSNAKYSYRPSVERSLLRGETK